MIGLGYFAGWVRDIDNTDVAQINALTVDFALPAALFIATAVTPRAVITSLWSMLVVFGIAMLSFYALSHWMQRRFYGMGPAAAAGLPLVAAVFTSKA